MRNGQNIKIVEGNSFTLLCPIVSRVFQNGKPIDTTIDATQLQNVVVKVNDEEWQQVRLETDGVIIEFPATLTRNTYNVTITATQGAKRLHSAYYEAFTIVEWNEQSNAEDYIFGTSLPVELPAAFILDSSMVEELTQVIYEAMNELRGENEEADLTAILSAIANVLGALQGSDTTADLSALKTILLSIAETMAKQGTDETVTLTTLQAAIAAIPTTEPATRGDVTDAKVDIINAIPTDYATSAALANAVTAVLEYIAPKATEANATANKQAIMDALAPKATSTEVAALEAALKRYIDNGVGASVTQLLADMSAVSRAIALLAIQGEDTTATNTAIMQELKTIKNDIYMEIIKQVKEVTYAGLKALRDSGLLVAGQSYRITDYVTKVANYDNARSAEHPFDLIVTALSVDTLDNHAKAIQHDGDDYFSGSNLAAWDVWYSIDNDTTRWNWADADNGKGVIYRLIDEWKNDCPYDFKNVLFKRWAVSDVTRDGSSIDSANTYIYAYGSQDIRFGLQGQNYSAGNLLFQIDDEEDYAFYYTFSWVNEDGEIEDASVVGNRIKSDTGVYGCHDNVMAAHYDGDADNDTLLQVLNNNVLCSTYSYDGGFYYGCYSNTFGNDCYSNTFGNDCYSNTFGNNCDSNTFGNNCYYNTFGNYCYSNTFGNDCYSNTFGNYCNSNTFGNECYSNTFGNECYSNTFGNYCNSNTFGGGAQNNGIINCMRYVVLENGVRYVDITCDEATDGSHYGQNILIHSGVVGTSQARKTCSVEEANAEYLTEFGEVRQGSIS